jgi:pimeloyl-ACP methyl ester carboxylesterase
MVDGETRIDGRLWRYSVSDNLDAPIWAVNVHGFFAGGGIYWRESARLAGRLGLRVINPNLPGFSGSEPLAWDKLRMPNFSRGLAALLDHLGAPGALMLGHSMGGVAALQFAHDYPERTLGVVYRDGVATSSWKERKGLMFRLLQPIAPDVGMALDLAAAFGRDLPDLAFSRLTSLAITAAPDIRLNARALTHTLPVGAMLLACDFSAMAERVASRSDVPVLPVWGRHDRIVPASTGREFGELMGEEVHWVRGGHCWMIARPGAQLDALRNTNAGVDFLERTRERAERIHRAA